MGTSLFDSLWDAKPRTKVAPPLVPSGPDFSNVTGGASSAGVNFGDVSGGSSAAEMNFRMLPGGRADFGPVPLQPKAPSGPDFSDVQGGASANFDNVQGGGSSRSVEVTPLTDEQERDFQAWAKKNGLTDVDHPASRYDYRGAYLANLESAINETDGLPHWPDTFKQHGHPTFSTESKYSKGASDGGRWEGETFFPQGSKVGIPPEARGNDGEEKPRADALDALWDAADFSDVEGGGSTQKPFGLARPDFKAIAPGVAANALNMVQGVPGAKAFEAAAGAIGSKFTDHPMSYQQAHDALSEMTDEIPAPLRVAERIVGVGPLAKLLPGQNAKTVWQATKSGAKVGAGLAGADAALSADPNLSLADRAKNAAAASAAGGVFGGTLGGGFKAGGKGIDFVRQWLRAKNAPTLGTTAHEIDKTITTATKANYGKAAEEGIEAGGSSPALAKAFERARTKKYVDMVRDGEEGSPTSDADVAREVYKLMSKARRGHTEFMARNGYDPERDREVTKLGIEMKRLKEATAKATVVETAVETAQSPNPDIRTALREHQARPGVAAARREGTVAQQKARQALERHSAEEVAAPPLRGEPGVITSETPGAMPSFPHAVSEKARAEGERAAFNEASDAAKRIMRDASVPGKKLLSQSPEAFSARIEEMSEGEAREALRAVLARAKEGQSFKVKNTLWGTATEVGGPVARFNRLLPFIKQLERKVGSGGALPVGWRLNGSANQSAALPPDLAKSLAEYMVRLNAPIANP